MIFNGTGKLTRVKELLVITCVDWIPLIAGGVFIRNLAYRLLFKKLGTSVQFLNRVEFTGANNIEIGSQSFIGRGSCIRTFKNRKILIGAKVWIEKGVIIITEADNCCIEIGENTFVGPYTYMVGVGNITIGKHCLIAAHCDIAAVDHIFSDPTELIRKQGVTRQGIVIEDNCWLGCGVKVLDGVTIGEGSVIGAGAVVTKNIPPYSVAVGVPAKVIRNRQLGEEKLAVDVACKNR